MSLRVGIRKTRMSLNDGRKPKLFDEVGPTIIYLYNIYGSHQATGQWGYCANTCAGV